MRGLVSQLHLTHHDVMTLHLRLLAGQLVALEFEAEEREEGEGRVWVEGQGEMRGEVVSPCSEILPSITNTSTFTR